MRLHTTKRAPTEGHVPPRPHDPDWNEGHGSRWREISLELFEADRLGVYEGKDWGCNSLEMFGLCMYGLEEEETEELLRVGKKLLDLPEIDGVFCDGWLTWEQVLLLAKVAVPEHEGAWLDRALELSTERLAALVVHSAEGWAPPTAYEPRAKVGGAAVETVAQALIAESWRGRARTGPGRFASGSKRLPRTARELNDGGGVAGFPRHRGAPDVRRAPGDAFSSA